jgi:hypothetical protein
MAKQTFTTGQVLTAAQMTSLQQTAMGGGSTTAKTASYTLVAADAGTTIIMNSGSATTVTVNTSLFAAGDTVFLVNQGAGVCTITAGTAAVSTAGSLAMAQNETGQLYFLSTSAAIFSEYTQTSSGASGFVPITPTSISVGSGSASSAGNGQVTFTTVGTNLSLNGVFSSTYDNYVLVYQGTHSTAANMTVRFRASGTDTTTSYYWNLVDYYSNNVLVDYNSGNNVTSIALNDNAIVETGFVFDIVNPFAAKKTLLSGEYNNWQTSTVRAQPGLNFATHSGTTAFDGITFLPSTGTISGTVSVYGLAK